MANNLPPKCERLRDGLAMLMRGKSQTCPGTALFPQPVSDMLLRS